MIVFVCLVCSLFRLGNSVSISLFCSVLPIRNPYLITGSISMKSPWPWSAMSFRRQMWVLWERNEQYCNVLYIYIYSYNYYLPTILVGLMVILILNMNAVCVRACVRACVRVCARVCVHFIYLNIRNTIMTLRWINLHATCIPFNLHLMFQQSDVKSETD